MKIVLFVAGRYGFDCVLLLRGIVKCLSCVMMNDRRLTTNDFSERSNVIMGREHR